MRIKPFGSWGSHQVTPCYELRCAAEARVVIADFDSDAIGSSSARLGRGAEQNGGPRSHDQRASRERAVMAHGSEMFHVKRDHRL